jgi:hypothetical protein
MDKKARHKLKIGMWKNPEDIIEERYDSQDIKFKWKNGGRNEQYY